MTWNKFWVYARSSTLYFYYKKKKSQGMKNKEKKIHIFDQELSTVRLELCLDDRKGTLHYIWFMTLLLKSNNMGLTLSFAFSTM